MSPVLLINFFKVSVTPYLISIECKLYVQLKLYHVLLTYCIQLLFPQNLIVDFVFKLINLLVMYSPIDENTTQLKPSVTKKNLIVTQLTVTSLCAWNWSTSGKDTDGYWRRHSSLSSCTLIQETFMCPSTRKKPYFSFLDRQNFRPRLKQKLLCAQIAVEEIQDAIYSPASGSDEVRLLARYMMSRNQGQDFQRTVSLLFVLNHCLTCFPPRLLLTEIKFSFIFTIHFGF